MIRVSTYTVKQVANMFKTNEETVRRWIRSGKLTASRSSKKAGNVITSAALNQFVTKTPKYAAVLAASVATSPLALSALVGGLIGGIFALADTKEDAITAVDVEKMIQREIAIHKKKIEKKQAEVDKLQTEIRIEEQELEKYKYALENLDLKMMATEINNAKGKEEHNAKK